MVDYSGQQLGNYRLLRLIGQGGFAAVYLGEHVRLGMKAALKLLHTHLSAPGDVELFQQEARTIAELRHPNIVRVLDFDVQQGQPFLVLDYAPSGSLQQWHSRGMPVAPDLVARYVTQMAAALQYAHDRRLIHRDVKPANMLIGEQETLLLSDFGIATIAHATSSMRTESSLGTLAYMAPEQLHGKPRPASDQYALAICAYLWLTGNLPFQGSSTEVIGQQLAAPPPSMRAQVPMLSAEIEQVVMKALAKDPAQRFASVQHFSQALAQASQSLNQFVFTPTRIELAHSQQSLQEMRPTPPLTATPPAPISPDKLFLPGRGERNEAPARVEQQLAPPPAVSKKPPRAAAKPVSAAPSATPVPAQRTPTRRIYPLGGWVALTFGIYSQVYLYFSTVPYSNEALTTVFLLNSCYCFFIGLIAAMRTARLRGALALCILSEAILALLLLAISYFSYHNNGQYGYYYIVAVSFWLIASLLLLNGLCSLLGCLLGRALGRRKRQPQPAKQPRATKKAKK